MWELFTSVSPYPLLIILIIPTKSSKADLEDTDNLERKRSQKFPHHHLAPYLHMSLWFFFQTHLLLKKASSMFCSIYENQAREQVFDSYNLAFETKWPRQSYFLLKTNYSIFFHLIAERIKIKTMYKKKSCVLQIIHT